MYFPSDMTFQYFFFDTYPGYFLQVLPIALIAGIIYGVVKCRNERSTPFWQKALSALFVCYVTGLICLVCLFDVIGDLWYRLLYHMDSGRIIRFFEFSWDANFIPDFFTHMDGEMIANVILFLPSACCIHSLSVVHHGSERFWQGLFVRSSLRLPSPFSAGHLTLMISS